MENIYFPKNPNFERFEKSYYSNCILRQILYILVETILRSETWRNILYLGWTQLAIIGYKNAPIWVDGFAPIFINMEQNNKIEYGTAVANSTVPAPRFLLRLGCCWPPSPLPELGSEADLPWVLMPPALDTRSPVLHNIQQLLFIIYFGNTHIYNHWLSPYIAVAKFCYVLVLTI